MARLGDNGKGEVKWYVPSIAALVIGLVAVIVVWVLIPPAETVHVPTFDEDDDRQEITLRLEEDATMYVVSGMANASAKFKVADGKMVYDPVEVKGPVQSIFRGVEYEGVFRGIWQLKDAGSGEMNQTITGIITGKAVIPWIASEKPSAQHDIETDCKILDEFPKGRFLVEGKLSVFGKPLLVGPGAVLENARTDKKNVALTDCLGRPYTIVPGSKVKLDSAGEFVEPELVDPTAPPKP